MTYKTYVRIGARRLLDQIAWDHSLGCAGGWDEIKKIEKRFGFEGYTIQRICAYDDERELQKAVRVLSVKRFEIDEIARMSIACARDSIRDLTRARGQSWVQSRYAP